MPIELIGNSKLSLSPPVVDSLHPLPGNVVRYWCQELGRRLPEAPPAHWQDLVTLGHIDDHLVPAVAGFHG